MADAVTRERLPREPDGAQANEARAVASLARSARRAARSLAGLSRAAKDAALCAWADALESRTSEILEANQADVERARTSGAAAAVIDRLGLDHRGIGRMADALRQVASLEDHVG